MNPLFWKKGLPFGHMRSIRSRLITLVLATLLPALLFFAWQAAELASVRRDLIERERAHVARQLSGKLDQEVLSRISELKTLAQDPNLLQADRLSADLHPGALWRHPAVMRYWLFSSEHFSAAKESIAPAKFEETSAGAEFSDRVLKGEIAVSRIRQIAPGEVSFAIGIPIERQGLPRLGLAVEIRALYLSQLLTHDVDQGEFWVSAAVDRDNRFVARSLDAARWAGELARPELGVAAKSAVKEGVFDNVTHEGVPMRNSYVQSNLTGWTTVVAVPESIISAPLQRNMWFVGLAAAFMLALTLVLTAFYARTISGPILALSSLAAARSARKRVAEPIHRISELEEVRSTLSRSIAQSAHLAAIVATSGDAIISVGIDGRIISWNGAAERMFGFSEADVIGKPKTIIIPEDRLNEYDTERLKANSGESAYTETVRRRSDGVLVDVSITSAPIRLPDGSASGISFVIRDIGLRKAAERHVRMIMRELAHRSKNQIAIIQSIARQTAAKAASLNSFSRDFEQRLAALATNFDLLMRQDWKGARISDLVKGQLASFAPDDSQRCVVEGPEVDLNSTYTEAIGLALHELATNASKYGAWSNRSGKVEIRWREEKEDDTTKVFMTWVESNGPPAEKPSTKGFGSLILEKMVARSVHGSAYIDYLPAGLQWKLEFPLPSKSDPAAI